MQNTLFIVINNHRISKNYINNEENHLLKYASHTQLTLIHFLLYPEHHISLELKADTLKQYIILIFS